MRGCERLALSWILLAGVLLAGAAVSPSGPAWASSVTVESTTAAPNSNITIDVSLQNDHSLRSLIIPLVIRSTTGGAYPSSITGYYPSGTRLSGTLNDVNVLNGYDTEDGSCKQNQPGGFGTIEGANNGPPDYAYTMASPDDPDALLFARTKIFAPDLPGGADPPGNPSIAIDVNVGPVTGTFKIDTTCANPANHLYFFFSTGQPDPNVSFVPGMITVFAGPGTGTVMYSTGGDGQNLISVDLTTGVGTTIGPSGYPETYAAAFTPDGTLWTITNGLNISLANLATFNLATGEATNVGTPFGVSEIIVALVCDMGTGTLYAAGYGGGFYTADKVTGQLSLVGTTGILDVMALAFDMSGTLWAIGGSNQSSDELHTITQSTGVSKFQTVLSASGAIQMALAISPGNTFYIVDYSGGASTYLRQLDPATGVSTPIGTGVGISKVHGGDILPQCLCPFQSDFDEDGFLTALDLGEMIDILFAGKPDEQDPLCPSPRADFDCDGFSTALDLGGLIDHLFAGGPPPCNPCQAPNPECVGSNCNDGFLECAPPVNCTNSLCFSMYEGGGVCVDADHPAISISCDQHTPCPAGTGDCPPGYICVVNTCCDIAVCLPEDAICGSPKSASETAQPLETGGPTVLKR